MTGELYSSDDIPLVVLALLDAEEYARRIQLVFDESVLQISHVDLTFAPWRIDLQRFAVGITDAELIGYAQSQDAIVHIGSMERIVAITFQNLADMGQLVVVVVHTFYRHHLLAVAIDSQCLVFKHISGYSHLVQLAYAHQRRIVAGGSLALGRSDFQLWVELREK